jgi:V-type H+-transporting ATPase subunit E
MTIDQWWLFNRNYSMQLNASRLKVLQAQDDLVGGMREEAEKQLATVNNTSQYEKLLKDLIVQV